MIPKNPRIPRIPRILTAGWLGLVFLWEVLYSGLTTAWLILRPGGPPAPGFVRVPFSGLSRVGAALLGGLITLTPGTTTLDVDYEREELLLHLLDASDPAQAARDIHQSFEAPLRKLFPREGSR